MCSLLDFQAPYNMPILWLCLLGLISWKLMWIPVIAKLPVGGPVSEWQFIFNWSLRQPYSYVFYLPLGVLWLTIVFKDVFKTRRKDMPLTDKKERKPLMEKLEPTHEVQRSQGFHNEAKAWSKTGRDFVQMIMDLIRGLFDF